MIEDPRAIETTLLDALQSEASLATPLKNPTLILGFKNLPLSQDSELELKAYLRSNLTPVGAAWKGPNVKCVACTLAVWGPASIITALGVAGFAGLTITTPVIVALASFAGASVSATLAFVLSLISSTALGIAKIANQLCSWAEWCL